MNIEWQDALMRLGAATAAGIAIGINRDLTNKPIGMRTLALVSLGAAAVTVASIQFSFIDNHPDALSRVVQGVIQGIMAGISFIGAGVILRDSAAPGSHRPDHRRDRVGHGRARHRLRARRVGDRRRDGHARAARARRACGPRRCHRAHAARTARTRTSTRSDEADQSSRMLAFLIASAHLAASLRRYSENSCGVLCSTSVPASVSFCRTTGSATAAT